VASQEVGDKVVAAVKSGKKFDALLDEYCPDKTLKEKGGDLGYLKAEDMERLSSELKEAVSKAAKATVLQKPFLVNGQWIVVRLEDKRKAEPPTFAQIKPALKNRMVPEFMVAVTLELIQKDGVKATDFNGKPIDFSAKELERSLAGVGEAGMAPD
jgi:peptidyl-prolyl cis-trans isomerase C